MKRASTTLSRRTNMPRFLVWVRIRLLFRAGLTSPWFRTLWLSRISIRKQSFHRNLWDQHLMKMNISRSKRRICWKSKTISTICRSFISSNCYRWAQEISMSYRLVQSQLVLYWSQAKTRWLNCKILSN